MKVVQDIKKSLATDVNWHRGAELGKRGFRSAPRATAEYLLDKVPIVGWLPKYNYKWLITDVIAGLTLGIMLIPQSLAYARIATMPVQYGLMSSWLPGILYAIMGTSKDLSTGPTSLIGLLTADIVAGLTKEGYSAQQVGSAVAMGMGVYGMILGFLKLGFLLDFVSTPVLNGFISAAAITIGLGQVDSLLGEEGVRDGTANTIHDIFALLPEASGPAAGIGFGSIAILVALEQVGKRWAKKYMVAFYLSILRAFICLLIFTGVGYAVNKNISEPDNYKFKMAQVVEITITAEATSAELFQKVISRSIAPFVAAAIESVAIARAFGNRNDYVTDTSQELCYLGVVNFFNSLFHPMGVGGAMSRTAVNSQCKVRSPLSHIVTSAVVLVCIYELTGALYWIPNATLAAIVITAIWPLIGSWRTYYHYWRTSFTDFVAAMLAFWISLFVSTEIGIATAVAWSIVCYLLRLAFTRVREFGSDSDNDSELKKSIDEAQAQPSDIPANVRVFKFNDNMFFPNAQRMTTQMGDAVQVHHVGVYSNSNGAERDRNWSVVGERRVKKLRKLAGVQLEHLPPIDAVVVDMSKTSHFDVTANIKMHEFVNELKKYAGDKIELRLVGVAPNIRARFERAVPGWTIIDGGGLVDEGQPKNGPEIRLFRTVRDAVSARTYADVAEAVEEKMKHDHVEDV